MAKLWGHQVGDNYPQTNIIPADSCKRPAGVQQLSKKCRRLLAAACQRGRVQPKNGGDSHFRSLVFWELLTPDGEPTEKGREWNREGE